MAGLAAARTTGRAVRVTRPPVERIASWLVVALAADLLLTRFVVRLAIFIPKGEPWASLSAVVGRVGAAVDALVPIVAILLLGALLARAGERRDASAAIVLGAVGVVAALGLALVVVPATPLVTVAVDVLVAAVAVGAAAGVARSRALSPLARAGSLAVAGSVVLAALARAAVASAGMPGAPAVDPAVAPAIDALGQAAFVLGAALVGLAGLARRGPVRVLPLAAGLAVALLVAAMAARAPQMVGMLLVWSVGLAGAVPVLLVGPALGLAVAGLPALRGAAPRFAVGMAIVLLAGYGLAASGLVLASLLGLVLAAWGSPTGLRRPA